MTAERNGITREVSGSSDDPIISVERVPPEYEKAVQDLCNRLSFRHSVE